MKNNFPVLRNNPEITFLDSAATMQKPQSVIDIQTDFLENSYAVVWKWNISLSKKCEEKISYSKKYIAEFFWTTEKNFCFTAWTTESINIFVQWMKNFLKKWDKVLVAAFEHNANFLPWANLRKEIWIEIEFLKPWKDSLFWIESFKEVFEKEWSEKIKVASIFHASNLTWDFFQDIPEISKFLKEKNVEFFLDCAQTIWHERINFDELWISCSWFSAHKIWWPTWIWGFYLNDELLEVFKPVILWWDSAEKWDKNDFEFVPWIKKFEAWTPKVDQMIWFWESVKFFEENFSKVVENERELTKYAFEKFWEFKNIQILWTQDFTKKAWIISFVIPWFDVKKIWEFFWKENISLRTWTHCNCIWNDFLCIPWSTRISFAVYNDKKDVDRFFEVLKKMVA